MESTITNQLISKNLNKAKMKPTNLSQADVNIAYIIQSINTGDEDMKGFLFTLGCYEGEEVTVISKLAENFVISVKDARYSIDQELAEAIIV
jgi:ferrous iron transport protein A